MSREIHQTAKPTTAALTALTPAVWGTTYIVATELLPAGRPMLAAALRALPVGLAFVLWKRQPLVAAGIAAVVLGEVFTRRTALAGAAGIAGVAMLVLGPAATIDPIGILAALAGTVTMGTGVVLTKHWGRPVDLITFTGWQLTAGGLMLVPVVLATEGLPQQLTGTNLAGFAWLAVVGTGAAYANWFRGIQRLPVAVVSFLGLLSPLVATFVGWAVLGETLTIVQLAGASLVVAAIIVSQLRLPGWRVHAGSGAAASEVSGRGSIRTVRMARRSVATTSMVYRPTSTLSPGSAIRPRRSTTRPAMVE